jgi:hypothetical protein
MKMYNTTPSCCRCLDEKDIYGVRAEAGYHRLEPGGHSMTPATYINGWERSGSTKLVDDTSDDPWLEGRIRV